MNLSKETNQQIFSLLCSADLDLRRISIADHDLNKDGLTLWLEDKLNFKSDIEDTLEVIIPIKDFETFIEENHWNQYEGTKKSRTGRVYWDFCTICEPIEWYNTEATSYQAKTVREGLLEEILKQIINA